MGFARPVFGQAVTLAVRATLRGAGQRVLQNARDAVLEFDETREFGGAGKHWSADELFLGSILASLANTYLYFTRRGKGSHHGAPGEGSLVLHGRVHVGFVPDVKAYRVTRVEVTGRVIVPEDARRQARELWDHTVRTCHLLHSIAPQVPVVVDVSVETGPPTEATTEASTKAPTEVPTEPETGHEPSHETSCETGRETDPGTDA